MIPKAVYDEFDRQIISVAGELVYDRMLDLARAGFDPHKLDLEGILAQMSGALMREN